MVTTRGSALRLMGRKVILREKQLADAANDYAWGSDRELVRLDAAHPFDIPFTEFLTSYVEWIGKGKNRWFAIETIDGKHIGNCACYNIHRFRKEAELGIIIGDRQYWGKGYGSDAVATLVHHIFYDMGLRRISLRTLAWNVRAQRCFEKCGFTPCGRIVKQGYEFVKMELYLQWTLPTDHARIR
ncbi:GNAT family N-acetyltransferase [Dehalococcoidia bacterium]|nr:GNAT family N-acetyltransferase [Dehalococcoidia bacterium]MCL0083957.1 GNAT family N-acetyltransferase [Dehalococcoidia bacterium]